VLDPWSLATSRTFWEGFSPTLVGDPQADGIRAVFRVEAEVVTSRGEGSCNAASLRQQPLRRTRAASCLCSTLRSGAGEALLQVLHLG